MTAEAAPSLPSPEPPAPVEATPEPAVPASGAPAPDTGARAAMVTQAAAGLIEGPASFRRALEFIAGREPVKEMAIHMIGGEVKKGGLGNAVNLTEQLTENRTRDKVARKVLSVANRLFSTTPTSITETRSAAGERQVHETHSLTGTLLTKKGREFVNDTMAKATMDSAKKNADNDVIREISKEAEELMMSGASKYEHALVLDVKVAEIQSQLKKYTTMDPENRPFNVEQIVQGLETQLATFQGERKQIREDAPPVPEGEERPEGDPPELPNQLVELAKKLEPGAISMTSSTTETVEQQALNIVYRKAAQRLADPVERKRVCDELRTKVQSLPEAAREQELKNITRLENTKIEHDVPSVALFKKIVPGAVLMSLIIAYIFAKKGAREAEQTGQQQRH